MLVKLTPGLNFINILPKAFTREDPKCIKMTVRLSICFIFLGSMSVKASHKTLMKLTPDRAGPSFYGRLPRMLRRWSCLDCCRACLGSRVRVGSPSRWSGPTRRWKCLSRMSFCFPATISYPLWLPVSSLNVNLSRIGFPNLFPYVGLIFYNNLWSFKCKFVKCEYIFWSLSVAYSEWHLGSISPTFFARIFRAHFSYELIF